MCPQRGTMPRVWSTVIDLTAFELRLLCCPTFNTRASESILVGAAQMSALRRLPSICCDFSIHSAVCTFPKSACLNHQNLEGSGLGSSELPDGQGCQSILSMSDAQSLEQRTAKGWAFERISLCYSRSHRGLSITRILVQIDAGFFAVKLHWDFGQPGRVLSTGVKGVTATMPDCHFIQVPLCHKCLGRLSAF